jgi:hypothetical protein
VIRGLSLTPLGLILWGVLNKEKALQRWRAATGLIISAPSLKQAWLGPKIIKPWCFRTKAFSL